jgi:hypothetical protein
VLSDEKLPKIGLKRNINKTVFCFVGFRRPKGSANGIENRAILWQTLCAIFLERRAKVLWRVELDRFRWSLEEYECVAKKEGLE